MIDSMNKRTVLFGLGGLLAMGLTGWLALHETSRKAPLANRAVAVEPPANRPAVSPQPLLNVTLPDLEGHEVSFRQFLGKPLVVNFWATWCAPCVQEMPDLDLMAKSLPDVYFVGIGIDTADNIRQFVDKVKVSYSLLVAGLGGISLLRELGNTTGGLPFTVMFDADGNIMDTILGQVQPEDLRARISALLIKSKT
jgi:thiol-disulfide isomerase/thioredoxin